MDEMRLNTLKIGIEIRFLSIHALIQRFLPLSISSSSGDEFDDEVEEEKHRTIALDLNDKNVLILKFLKNINYNNNDPKGKKSAVLLLGCAQEIKNTLSRMHAIGRKTKRNS